MTETMEKLIAETEYRFDSGKLEIIYVRREGELIYCTMRKPAPYQPSLEDAATTSYDGKLHLWENVMIDYTNWRGERHHRRIRPLTIRFECSEWHPDEQWLLRAVDIEAGATRDFAMKDIHSWRPLQPSPEDAATTLQERQP